MHARRGRFSLVLVMVAVAVGAVPAAAGAMPNVRLSNDNQPGVGYISNYTSVTGRPYTDPTLTECAQSRGRQNEPSVAIDPRDSNVLVGSSNDYCGVYNSTDANNVPQATGPIWLGYYRSQDGGRNFQSSLVPGYPGDTSPYAARAQIRTASAGDPVLAWDKSGRLYAGSESSGDAAGTKKGFGDVFVATYENPDGSAGPTANDGKEFKRSVTVAKGSSAPLTGKFNDKTAIEVDRTNTSCAGNVYFAYSSYTGSGGNTIRFARSTDNGRTFSQPINLGPVNTEIQFPDIAVTGNGHVYVTFRQIAGARKNAADQVLIDKSTDCGKTFTKPSSVTGFTPYDAEDVPAPVAPARPSANQPDAPFAEEAGASGARDCGSLDTACASGYTFFRRDTQVRSTADQSDTSSENVFIVYDPTIPGTETPSGTTYGSVGSGTGSQSGIYFTRYNGATGTRTAPSRIDVEARGHQLFPDIAVDRGTLHALWWDSRNDPTYDPRRPVGNDAAGHVFPSLDVYATKSTDGGLSWDPAIKQTDHISNPNYEQFSGRLVPFAGDYLWVDAAQGRTYGVWTDWRDTIGGTDQREPDSTDGADVLQCRTTSSDGTVGPDTCPEAGGLDQNIYGDDVLP